MERGDLYRAAAPARDPRRSRVYVVVSRQDFLRTKYATAVCVPIYSTVAGLATEVLFDERNGLKHLSAARCDEVTSVPRAQLTDFVGRSSPNQLHGLARGLALACSIDLEDLAG